jgi:MFS-type transporter involved in bile tolerance (Atg22 family)
VTFLLSNFKLIYLPIINDDHFLGYCLIANTITAILGTFIWGFFGDKFKFAKTMLILVCVDCAIKIFGIFSNTKETLFILMLLLGFTSRGMQTISGAGLI